MNDIRAELIRAKAYLSSYLVWPIMLAVIALSDFLWLAFSSMSKTYNESIILKSCLQLPGVAIFFPGTLLALWVNTLVTADRSSGTIHHIHTVMNDSRILVAKSTLAAAGTVITAIISICTAISIIAFYYPSLLASTLSDSTFWYNSLGAFIAYLFWAILALATAFWLPRGSISMMTAIGIMIAIPVIDFVSNPNLECEPLLNAPWGRCNEWLDPFSYLPYGLIEGATFASDFLRFSARLDRAFSILFLLLWCVVLLLLCLPALRRWRVYR